MAAGLFVHTTPSPRADTNARNLEGLSTSLRVERKARSAASNECQFNPPRSSTTTRADAEHDRQMDFCWCFFSGLLLGC